MRINMIDLETAFQLVDEEIVDKFVRSMRFYLRSTKKLTRVACLNCYGSSWQKYLFEDKEKIQKQLDQDIDKAFTTLTVMNKLYKQATNGAHSIMEGAIGKPRAKCTEEEWASFRPMKAEVLDAIESWFTTRSLREMIPVDDYDTIAI